MHLDQATSRNGLLGLVQILLGIIIFSLIYNLLLSDALRFLQVSAFLFFANGILIFVSVIISGSGIEGTFYFKVYHFVALVLYIGLPVWSIVNGDQKGTNNKGQYWAVVALSFVDAFVHGIHGVFNVR